MPTASHAHSRFAGFAKHTAHWTGRPTAFFLAVLIIVVWGLTGPVFGWSDTWQLVINTSTTVITFLMVFLIQNTQNRDSVAVQIKLDELIRAVEGAQNVLLDLEEMDEKDLLRIKTNYERLAARAREILEKGGDADCREARGSPPVTG